jgi:hypothetical protein
MIALKRVKKMNKERRVLTLPRDTSCALKSDEIAVRTSLSLSLCGGQEGRSEPPLPSRMGPTWRLLSLTEEKKEELRRRERERERERGRDRDRDRERLRGQN